MALLIQFCFDLWMMYDYDKKETIKINSKTHKFEPKI